MSGCFITKYHKQSECFNTQVTLVTSNGPNHCLKDQLIKDTKNDIQSNNNCWFMNGKFLPQMTQMIGYIGRTSF